jgi:DNA-directed RNA polymerase specialized sigma24 family protein
MLLSLVYFAVRRMLRLLTRGDKRDDVAREIEILVLRHQLGPVLAQALDGIRSSDRDALLLFAWNDLSYEEVAVALSVPVGTVASRISRARLRLRASLAELDCRPEQTRS